MNKNKILGLSSLLICAFLTAPSFTTKVAAATPGSQDDPVISQSLLDFKINALQAEIDALQAQMDALKNNKTPTPPPTPPTPPPTTPDYKTATITASVLNVRSGHSTSYPKIGTLYKNNKVQAYESVAGWTHIISGNCNGWVINDYISY